MNYTISQVIRTLPTKQVVKLLPMGSELPRIISIHTKVPLIPGLIINIKPKHNKKGEINQAVAELSAIKVDGNTWKTLSHILFALAKVDTTINMQALNKIHAMAGLDILNYFKNPKDLYFWHTTVGANTTQESITKLSKQVSNYIKYFKE